MYSLLRITIFHRDVCHFQGIASEVIPFLCSGSHVIQKDCHPSALHTFTEALAQCNPPVTIRPAIMKYLGKSHNLWHRMTLLLEQLSLEQGATSSPRSSKKDFYDSYDMEPVVNPQQVMFCSFRHWVFSSSAKFFCVYPPVF